MPKSLRMTLKILQDSLFVNITIKCAFITEPYLGLCAEAWFMFISSDTDSEIEAVSDFMNHRCRSVCFVISFLLLHVGMKASAFHHRSSWNYFMLSNFTCSSCRSGSEKAETLDFLNVQYISVL